LGPAVSQPMRLRALMEAGVNVVRVNAAHGSPEERAGLIANIREAADAIGKRVPILFDLQGLKIRTGPLVNGENDVGVERDDQVRLQPEPVATTREHIGVNYSNLLDVISQGSRVLISDGLSELRVESVETDHATATVIRD